ncbi:MAG: arsenate reductase ArsC [Candidatus Binatia bacterium]
MFLCTGNSARSIFAEVLLNRIGQGRFRAFSAGSHPKGDVHPLTLSVLAEFRESTEGLRSKDWDEFAKPDSPRLDFAFTVCSKAAGKQCPLWPGQPMTAHWGVDDPAAAVGSDAERLRAFRAAYRTLQARIRLFTSLRVELLDRLTLQREIRKIGESDVRNG